MKIFITGAAGFIGSTVVDRMLADGHTVIGVDNLSTGRMRFLQSAQTHPQFFFCEADLKQKRGWTEHLAGCDLVFHFAANADLRFGQLDTRRDLNENVLATLNLLEEMRHRDVPRLAFSSTGSVYGDAATIPTPEDAPMPLQTSLYGASKVAAEGFIQAFCEYYGLQAWIFRFVSLLGERYHHGHVYDFVRQLRQDPSRLRILGDGEQRKSYLYLGDCIEAMLVALRQHGVTAQIFNLGSDQYCSVVESAGYIAARMKLDPEFELSGGRRGWVGDNPFLYLATDRIRSLGWRPALNIRQGIERTVDYLLANPWLFEHDPRDMLAVPSCSPTIPL